MPAQRRTDLLSGHLRVISALTLGVLAFLVGAVSVDAAAPDPTSISPPCSTALHRGVGRFLTLDEARACAPGALILSSSDPIKSDGKFIVERGKGYQVVERSTTHVATRAGGDPCVIGSVTVIDGGGVIEFLSSYLCWNYSVAWAYGVQANCINFMLGFFCLGRYSGTFGNYSRLAGAWGNFYNFFPFPPFNFGEGLRLDVQPNGNWWGWAYDCGKTC